MLLKKLSFINKFIILFAYIPDKKKVKKIKLWFSKTLDTSSENCSNLTIKPASNKYIWEK